MEPYLRHCLSIVVIVLCAALITLPARGADLDDCGETSCALPAWALAEEEAAQGASEPPPSVAVVCPVPGTSIEPMAPAPRLDTLDGKTIALVGGSFMANVTHPELRRLILAEFPTAKVYLLDEIGSAGPYPRPGVTRRAKDEFQQRLREFSVDAVISGNGGCGLCTPKETGSCLAAEVLGIPSVMIAAPGFVQQARSTAQAAGLDALAIAEYPGPFASHTREELLENTRTILWPQVKNGLTTPLPAADSASAENANSTDYFVTEAEALAAFAEAGWTDGLPIVLPTSSAVAEFLRFTDLPPDASIGDIPPAQRAVTPRHVAANGVMAGCPPEFMPLLLAFVEAMKDGDFRRPLSSTHAWTPYCWLNGPVARQLGFDCAQGEISEARNAQLGRFINLALLNLGGYRVKDNRMGTFGYLMPWCLAEDEAAALAVGWKPHHMQRGFALNDSTLTAASAINWGNNLVPATADPERIKDMIAWDAAEKSQMALASGMPCVYRVFLLTPGVARDLAAAYPSKAALEQALVATSRIPLGQRAFANYWGNPGSALDAKGLPLRSHEARIAEAEGAIETPTPPWLDWTGQPTLPTVPAMEAGKSVFLVTGDPARNKELCVPGGGFATIKLNLPADWDALMAERGYPPLSSFYLSSNLAPDTPQGTRPRYRNPGMPESRGERSGGRERMNYRSPREGRSFPRPQTAPRPAWTP